ncbi:hypothetical protein ALC56_12084, partial [Trachymyrmex septentrionalis]
YFTSVGKENVNDCWNGHEPDDKTCILKSISKGSAEFVKCLLNCSFRSFDTPISLSSSSASSGFLLLFLSSRSQYLANSSGDLLLLFAALVTELLLINRPQALSRAATKPLSLLNATSTKALYFLCTSKIVFT